MYRQVRGGLVIALIVALGLSSGVAVAGSGRGLSGGNSLGSCSKRGCVVRSNTAVWTTRFVDPPTSSGKHARTSQPTTKRAKSRSAKAKTTPSTRVVANR